MLNIISPFLIMRFDFILFLSISALVAFVLGTQIIISIYDFKYDGMGYCLTKISKFDPLIS